jgi:hypothetical protein
LLYCYGFVKFCDDCWIFISLEFCDGNHFSLGTLRVIWCKDLICQIPIICAYFVISWIFILLPRFEHIYSTVNHLLSWKNLNLIIEQLSRFLPKWLYQFHEFLERQVEFENCFIVFNSVWKEIFFFKLTFSNYIYFISLFLLRYSSCCRYFGAFLIGFQVWINNTFDSRHLASYLVYVLLMRSTTIARRERYLKPLTWPGGKWVR